MCSRFSLCVISFIGFGGVGSLGLFSLPLLFEGVLFAYAFGVALSLLAVLASGEFAPPLAAAAPSALSAAAAGASFECLEPFDPPQLNAALCSPSMFTSRSFEFT